MMGSALRYFIHQFDPYHDHLKQAVRTTLACVVSLFLYQLFLATPESFWMVLTSVLILQTRLGASTRGQLLSVVLSSASVVVLAGIGILLTLNTLLLAVYIGSLGGLATMLSSRNVMWRQRSFFILAIVIVTTGVPLAQEGDIGYRILFIFIGGLIAVGCSGLMLQNESRRFKRAKKLFLVNIEELVCWYCQLMCRGKFNDRMEERLHHRRVRLIQLLSVLSQAVNESEVVCKVTRLRQIIVALGNYRFFYQNDSEKVKAVYQYLSSAITKQDDQDSQLSAELKQELDQLLARYYSLKHDVEGCHE